MLEVLEPKKNPFDLSGEADRYMVVFWREHNPGVWDEEQALVKSDSVKEVLAWAEREAHGRMIQLYVVVDEAPEAWVLRILGPEDPTFGDKGE